MALSPLLSCEFESIDLFNVDATDIPPGLFRKHLYLKKFIFPKNLKSIGVFSFSDCLNLETVILPNTLEEIGKCAFEYCEKLNLILPNNVTRGKYTFNGCHNVHFSEIQNNNNATTNTPSKNVFSSVIDFIYSWF